MHKDWWHYWVVIAANWFAIDIGIAYKLLTLLKS